MDILPLESLVPMLEALDARGLAVLRRAAKFHTPGGQFAREMHVAELRAAVLEQLVRTVFPFTHAAYVLGLNGPYYSYDTFADDHYGIPKGLPSMLCRYFRLAVPGVPFTTVRLQKLTATGNFGGQHRTLAFSLASPEREADSLLPDEDPGEEQDAEDDDGYCLFLTPGCTGGRGDVRDDIYVGSWQLLASPSQNARWVKFPRKSWLRWHWPSTGVLFAITVTCEPPLHREKLSARERQRMSVTGFLLPNSLTFSIRDDSAEEMDTGHRQGADEGDTPAIQSEPRRQRRSAAAVQAARRILGLNGDALPSELEVERAFRSCVRAAHPDREEMRANAGSASSAADGGNGQSPSWSVAQIHWARKVLRDASCPMFLPEDVAPEGVAPQLMLGDTRGGNGDAA